jgi:hypothetical protein
MDQEHHIPMRASSAAARRQAAKPRIKGAARGTATPKQTRRTTVTLSALAAEIVERFMAAARISVSEAVSELVVRAEAKPARIKWVNGLPVADVSLDGKWISTEDVLHAEVEPW